MFKEEAVCMPGFYTPVRMEVVITTEFNECADTFGNEVSKSCLK